jgi:hypothetical protein
MNEAPLPAGSHRVRPGLAQKAEVIGMNQFFHRVGVAIEMLLEKINGARVLLASEDQFFFMLAASLLVNTGQHREESDHEHRDRDD